MTRDDEIRDEYVNVSTYTDEGRAYQQVLEEVLDENQRLREALEFMARGYVAGDYTDMRQFARRTLDGEAE